MSTSSTLIKSTNRNPEGSASLLNLPYDTQINVLTYLRAYDLSALQKTCKFYANPELIDKVVTHFAEEIYPAEWMLGFESSQPVSSKGKLVVRKGNLKQEKLPYTFENLRHIELQVVARVLSSPEPVTGFFVSKSWCKTALRWLEVQQEQSQRPKKLSKKKKRLHDRKLSDASPPWPNANIDLLCEHQNLQHFSSSKSARARRRLLDRQAWRILKKLYPDSTQLESALGECLHCTLELETAKKNEANRIEKEKLERKRPLANEEIRRFYTRRTGVPSQSILATASLGQCPLEHGNYYVLPRSWCYAWRRYIKTGEGGSSPPPDVSSLLCDAHRLALLPPHLEAYLYGDSAELLVPHGDNFCVEILDLPNGSDHTAAPAAQVAGPHNPGLVPGQGPDPDMLEALRVAGVGSPLELGRQLSMFRELEDIQRPAAAAAPAQPQPSTPLSGRNKMLDCENYSVVEILTEKEYMALESCWGSGHGFRLQFSVSEKGVIFHTTQLCRECDATGRPHALYIKNRSRRAIRKSSEKARAPASLEY